MRAAHGLRGLAWTYARPMINDISQRDLDKMLFHLRQIRAYEEEIAKAGGTGQAFDVTNDVTLFAQKMQEIRAQALG